MRKRFEELGFLDQEHLRFLSMYQKRDRKSWSGSLDNLNDIGTVVKSDDFGLGVVVDYCAVGYEYVLFEDDRSNHGGYLVCGMPKFNYEIVKEVEPKEIFTLTMMMNEYLIKNFFKYPHTKFNPCYEYWIKTGLFDYENHTEDIPKRIAKLKNEILAERSKLHELEKELGQLILLI